jgi:hypothetical protein
MTRPGYSMPAALTARMNALSDEHRRGVARFMERLEGFARTGLLTPEQAEIVGEHLVRLGERNRNPANTGNIEDLFCHTLEDTRDPIRAYAQALADSVKVVPMEEDAPLDPPMRKLDGTQWYRKVGDFQHLSPGDKMLVTHTMVAYGDREMWESAAALVRVTHPHLNDAGVQRLVAKMAVQSQHLPSSSFVLARASGLTVQCAELYARAGYSEQQQRDAQTFYDICAEYNPAWSNYFIVGQIPDGPTWLAWRARYLAARAKLPPELIYQLSSDTLTNFLDGTLESGKWTDATVFFGGVTASADVPQAIARIVNQYIAEHVALHDRPVSELTVACAPTLAPWGIGFEHDRAVVLTEAPEKAELLHRQFEAAMARKRR